MIRVLTISTACTHGWASLAFSYLAYRSFLKSSLFPSLSFTVYCSLFSSAVLSGVWKFLNLHYLIFCTVGSWICNLLVPRWFKKQQGHPSSMACILWNLHLCPGCCYLRYWNTRESHISSNQQGYLTLLCWGITSEFFGCLDYCSGWFCYSRCYFSWKWQRRNS